MGLFGNKEAKEDKKEKAIEMLIKRYQLEDIDVKDIELIKKIASDLWASDSFTAPAASAKAEELVKMSYLSALVDQNWIIIKQLSRLNSTIEKLTDK